MALCFEVTVNEDTPAVAGASEARVLTAILSYVSARSELILEVGAMGSGREHLDWIKRELKVGDVVAIRIVDSDAPDRPVKRSEEPSFLADQERAYYERLRRKYEGKQD